MQTGIKLAVIESHYNSKCNKVFTCECKQVMSFSDAATHIPQCINQINLCPLAEALQLSKLNFTHNKHAWQCQWKGTRRELKEHLKQTNCQLALPIYTDITACYDAWYQNSINESKKAPITSTTVTLLSQNDASSVRLLADTIEQISRIPNAVVPVSSPTTPSAKRMHDTSIQSHTDSSSQLVNKNIVYQYAGIVYNIRVVVVRWRIYVSYTDFGAPVDNRIEYMPDFKTKCSPSEWAVYPLFGEGELIISRGIVIQCEPLCNYMAIAKVASGQ